MVRRDRTGEHVMYHPLVDDWLENNGDTESLPDFFVASNDLTPQDHVLVQATIQEYTDSSISKTCNAPNDHAVEQVNELYLAAYDLGCKGVTYYRDGSRDAVLTHLEEKPKVEEPKVEEPKVEEPKVEEPKVEEPVSGFMISQMFDAKSPAATDARPTITNAHTHRIETPVGTAFVTWGRNPDTNALCECFITVGHGGSDIAADAEAIGRLISLVLRLNATMDYNAKVDAIIDQLAGIGGRGSVGFGILRVRSLADGVAQTLRTECYNLTQKLSNKTIVIPKFANLKPSGATSMVDICPGCGSATLVHEEGCAKCHSCGYSAC
jgi:ribonucleoside-diphosphate reductase alpha chain